MTDTVAGVLSDADATAVRDRFGVDDEQIRRDHVISHVLGALSEIDSLVFFGGTALSRTHLTDLRLSEDIDLIALGRRDDVVGAIETVLRRRLGRPFGTPRFDPALGTTRGAEPSVMTVGEVRVQIQVLPRRHQPPWPTELRSLEQRYSDAPTARMTVLTAPAFAAAKLSAWHDRRAARDLYDMWGLAERDLIDEQARQLFSTLGPVTDAGRVSFDEVPTDREWQNALGHQGIIRVGPEEAATRVRAAWSHERTVSAAPGHRA